MTLSLSEEECGILTLIILHYSLIIATEHAHPNLVSY